MKKLLLTILAIFSVAFAAFGFVGCGEQSSAEQSSAEQSSAEQKAPTISVAETSLNLVVGYDKTESDVFTVTGDDVTITLSFDQSGKSAQGYVVYDSSAKKLTVRSGLDAGVYKLKVTAANKGGGASVNFVIKVAERTYMEYSEEVAAMTLPYGYASCETEKFLVSGENVKVTVTTENDADKFGWNENDDKMTIAEGLEKGEYSVTVTASDGKSENDVSVVFTVTVADAISGKNELRLLEGDNFDEKYELLSEDYTVTPVAPESAGNAFSFKNGVLSVAAGLKKGEYAVTLKVGGGLFADKQFDFNLTIKVISPNVRFTDESGVSFNDDGSVAFEDNGKTGDYGTQKILRGGNTANREGEGFVLKYTTTVANGVVNGGVYFEMAQDGITYKYSMFIKNEQNRAMVQLIEYNVNNQTSTYYNFDKFGGDVSLSKIDDGEITVTIICKRDFNNTENRTCFSVVLGEGGKGKQGRLYEGWNPVAQKAAQPVLYKNYVAQDYMFGLVAYKNTSATFKDVSFALGDDVADKAFEDYQIFPKK